MAAREAEGAGRRTILARGGGGRNGNGGGGRLGNGGGGRLGKKEVWRWGRKVGIMAVDVTTDPGPVVGEEGCHGYIQLQALLRTCGNVNLLSFKNESHTCTITLR
jgi:hypothetical protein